MSRRSRVVLPVLAAGFVVGCGAHLHDPEVERTTAQILQDHRAADVGGAIQAALEQQVALDAREIEGVVDAASTSEAFEVLRLQGEEETAHMAAPPPSSPPVPKVKLPVEKVAAVAKATDQLGDPADRLAEIERLVEYARELNRGLETVDEKAGVDAPGS